MLGSPPALAGWLVLLCAVITVALFAALMVVPDRGRQQLLIDPDASRIDQRFGRGEELLTEDRVEAWSEMAAFASAPTRAVSSTTPSSTRRGGSPRSGPGSAEGAEPAQVATFRP